MQAKREGLRFEYENLNDDNNHYRKHITSYQLLKSSILDEITRQRGIHQRLQMEVEDLRMQKQISTQAHEADTQVCLAGPILSSSNDRFSRLLKFTMIIFCMISQRTFVLMVMEKMF